MRNFTSALFLLLVSAAAQPTSAVPVFPITGVPLPPTEMRVPAPLRQKFAFEPSGAIYLEDIDRFLVISDDTDDNNSAVLFLSDREGQVDDQVLPLPGLKKVSDLESISQSGDSIYLLTSQGLTKEGKNKKSRNLFVRLKRSGLNFYETESVDFKEALITAIKHSGQANLQSLFPNIDKGDIEIESHFVDGDDLYVGFKKPQRHSTENIILRLKDFETLFSDNKIGQGQLELWQSVDFGAVKGAPHRLSDLIKIKNQIYATTVCEDEDCGAVWRLQDVNGKLRPLLLQEYDGLIPEGIAVDVQNSSLFVVFDEKHKPGKFARVPLTSP